MPDDAELTACVQGIHPGCRMSATEVKSRSLGTDLCNRAPFMAVVMRSQRLKTFPIMTPNGKIIYAADIRQQLKELLG